MNPPKPKIGLYQPYPHTFGGLQAVVLKIARALPGFGFTPVIISPETGAFIETVRSEEIPFLVSDPGPEWHVYGRGGKSLSYLFSPRRIVKLLRYWRQLSLDLRQNSISLLHCNDYRGVMLAAPAARLAGIPVLWHMHGFISSRLANLAASALVQWTVPVSRGMLDYLKLPRWLFGKYEVIYNGLETDPEAVSPPSPPLPHPLSDPSSAQTIESARTIDEGSASTKDSTKASPVVLAIGALHPRKGFATLIHAFKKVADQIPQAECWIAGGEHGDGSHGKFLRELAAKLGLSENIKFLGHRSDVRKFLGRCTLVAIPSQIEPFGMVALEAMLAGKPVVASRTGGLPEIVLDRASGSLVEPGDAAALASAILEILTNLNLSRQMGQAGRTRVLTQFTIAKMTAAFASRYKALLQGACS